MTHRWSGVMPAITTPFREDQTVDTDRLAGHVSWLISRGCTGIIALGSLGEGATLDADEKHQILCTCVDAIRGKVPLLAAVSGLGTRSAVTLAKNAVDIGCDGLMVLPPYVHRGPWSETEAHLSAIIRATSAPCMLYNNPAAYGMDIKPEWVAHLAAKHDNLVALKESSGDPRRITAVRALIGERLDLFAGLDDMVVECIAAGAVGWVAGLANALPDQSIELFRLARAEDKLAAFELYRWFLPLLRMDTVPEFVQLIKLVQAKCGKGQEAVRLPRQALRGPLREEALAIIDTALRAEPNV